MRSSPTRASRPAADFRRRADAAPDIVAIIDAAQSRPIRHVMINTNGIRIAQDPDFVRALAERKTGLEIYLQFDSLERDALMTLRGADLRRIRQQALEALERHGISTTLVHPAQGRQRPRGQGHHRPRAGLELRARRHLPAGAGCRPQRRLSPPRRDRLVLSEVRRTHRRRARRVRRGRHDPAALQPGFDDHRLRAPQWPPGHPGDLADSARSAARRHAQHRGVRKVSRTAEAHLRAVLALGGRGTITERLSALLCCLPEVPVPQGLDYSSIFRVAVIGFMDRHNFSVGSVKRSCVHFVTPNGQIIPFETYNLFYRDGGIDRIRRRLDQRFAFEARCNEHAAACSRILLRPAPAAAGAVHRLVRRCLQRWPPAAAR